MTSVICSIKLREAAIFLFGLLFCNTTLVAEENQTLQEPLVQESIQQEEEVESSGVAIDAPEDMARYYSRDYRISIEFPKGWELAPPLDPTTIGAVSPREGAEDAFRENALVGSFPLEKDLSIQDYFEGNFKFLKQKLEDLEVVILEPAELDGQEAIHLVYASTIEGKKYYTMQVFTVKDQRGYIVTGMGEDNTFENYEKIFKKIADSFRFE